MKPKSTSFFAVSRAAVLAAASTCIAFAGDGTWAVNANGDWGTPGNWNGGTPANVADGSGSTASFTNDIDADRTVNLEAPRTIGNIDFGDAVPGTPGSWILSGASALNLAGTTPTVTVSGLGTAKTATIGTVVAGADGLTKAGSGTLVLSGANTLTGTVNVNAGTLTSAYYANAANSFLGGPGTTGSHRTVNIASGTQVTYTSGTANSFLHLGGNIATGGFGSYYDLNISGTLAINDGGVVSQILQSTYNLTNGGIITNTGTAHTGAYGLLFNWNNGSGQGNITATGTGNQITADRIGFFSGATVTTNPGADLTITAKIGDFGAISALTKAGDGSLILTNANTHSGATSVSGGVLKLSNANALSVSTFAGGAGSLAFDSLVLSHAFVVGGLSGSSNLTLADDAVNAVALSVGNNNQAASYSGGLSGAGSLTKIGTGTQTLTGANSYAGATTVNAGTLQFGKAASFHNSTTGGVSGANAALLTVNSGATAAFNVGGANEFNATDIDTLLAASNGTVGFKGGSTLGLDTTGGNFSDASIIANPPGGTLGLTKLGSNMLTLTATNTYTGTTTVRAGVLSLNASAPTILGSFVMNGADGTYARMQQANQIGAGVVANFTSASGSWNRFECFGKDQTFAGIITGNSTTQGGGIIQNSEVNGAAGAAATLTLNGSGTYLFNGHVRDFGNPAAGTNKLSLIKNGSGFQTLAGTVVSYSGTTTINNGRLALQDTTQFNSAVTINGGATLELTGTGSWNLNTVISGTGNLHKTGTGTVILKGANTHDGTTTVDAGILALDYSTQNNPKLSDNGALIWNGGTIQLTGATGNQLEAPTSVTINGNVNLTRSGANTSALALGNYKNFGGLNVAATGLATTSVANNGSGYLDGVTFAGNQLAMNDGSGNIVAKTGATYDDFSRLSSGTKAIAAPSVAGAITRLVDGTGTAANITIPATTLDINTLFHTATGATTTLDLTGGILRLPANGSIISATGSAALTIQNGTLTAGGAADTPGTLTVQNGSSNAITISSTLANNGTGALSLRTLGNVTVSGAANSYTGSTTVVAGTLTLSNSALATTSGYSIGDVSATGANATLKFAGGFTNNRPGVGATTLRDISPITIVNNGTGTTTLDIDSSSNNWINGLVTLNKAVVLKSTGAGGVRGGFVTLSGTGAGAGNDSVIYDATGSGNDANWNTYENTGTYTTQPNTYTGNVRFTGGTTIIQNKSYANAAYINLMIPDTSSVKIDAGSTLKFAWGGESFDGLNDGVGGGGVMNTDTAATFTIGTGNGNGSFSGTIANGAAALTLKKSGAGTQTFSGANTYNGGTTVEGGTLLLNNSSGSGAGAGAITVQSGATLGGNGSASGATTIDAGGTVAPGTSTGTLTLGSATLAGTYQCQLGATTGDRLTVTGALTISPGAAITVSTLATPTAASYTILSYGSLPNALPTITPPAGYTVNTSTPGEVKLVKIGSGYGSWAATNAPTGTPVQDYDGDGVSNALEWILGGLASTNDLAKLPTVSTSGGNLVFTFVRNDEAWQSGDTTTQIEVGSTLASWPSVYNVGIDTASSSAGVTVTDNGTTDTVTLSVPMGADSKKFARLKATVTP